MNIQTLNQLDHVKTTSQVHLETVVIESRGFAARSSGDSFINPLDKSDLATFEDLTVLPENSLGYENQGEFLKAYYDWKNSNQKTYTIYELNSPISVIRAAFIVKMQTPRGPEAFVLFTKDLKTLEGKLTAIPPHVVAPSHGGYVLNRATSLSERAGVKPSDVISGKKQFKPSQVPDLLEDARATAGDQLVDQMQSYLHAMIAKKGKNFVIKDGAVNASVFQKYLGEWAAPLALIYGQFEPLHQLSELQDAMLEGESLKKGKVIYNTSVSDTLIDSIVDVMGSQIAISSKAHKGGGAAASLKGLHDTMMEKAHEFDPKFWKQQKNAKFKHIVSVIQENTAITGVLTLAQDEQIVSAPDVLKIKRSIQDKTSETFSVKTQKLMATYAANENHPNYNAGKHALAAVARALCKKLNDENFTLVAKAVLNKSNVVQMMFVTGTNGKDFVAKHFQLIWPPRFDGEIKFYSAKNFSATEIKGKLGFKIVKGTDPDDAAPDESLTAPSMSEIEIKARKKSAELAVGKIVQPGERDKRDPRIKDVVALGRGKKKK